MSFTHSSYYLRLTDNDDQTQMMVMWMDMVLCRSVTSVTYVVPICAVFQSKDCVAHVNQWYVGNAKTRFVTGSFLPYSLKSLHQARWMASKGTMIS
jgi:hypothetical protein